MFPEKFFSSAYKNVLATEEDIFFEDNLTKSEAHLLLDNVYKSINSNTVYNYEKNNATLYRLIFTLDVYATNVLFNITSVDSYESLITERVFIPEEEVFTYTENEILLEENGWFGYLTGLSNNDGCSRNLFRPYPTDLSILSNNGFKNYDINLTYEYEKDDSITFNNIPLSQGIAIYSSSTVTIDNRSMTKIVTPIRHNLSENNQINIYGLSGNTNYFVYRLGDENSENFDNMFIIDEIDFIDSLPVASFKKNIDGVLSNYYITKHKKIESEKIIYKNAFANSVYSDSIFSINFNRELNIGEYKDAFNRPLTKVFLTIVKKRHTEYENFFFNSIKSGIYTIFANSDYDINSLTDVQGVALEDNINSDDLYGNVVEFNDIEQKLYYIEPIYHRFNSKNRSNNGYHEGYYYLPHYEITLREFSEYINETTELDAPDYAFQYNENRYLYRDLNDNDFSSLWPFTNGFFYVYEKASFFLKRQDPCFTYGSWNQNPIAGKCKDFTMKKINLPQNQC